MNTNHNHQWIIGKEIRICKECSKVEVSPHQFPENKQSIMEVKDELL